jgi:poly-gamma-glutamate capsule biosynthesis protein CapA/YwtB (metallophosphatase superfamily)
LTTSSALLASGSVRVRALVLVAALLATGCTSRLSLTEEPVSATAIGEPALVDADPAPSTTSTITSSTTTATEPPPEPLVLGFAGDVNMISGIESRRPLDAVATILSGPDLMMVNLETVVGEAGEVGTPPIPKEFVFRSPPEILDQLTEAGVDVVGLANNHSWDYGPLGVAVTAERVGASDLIGVGTGPDAAAAHAPAFIEVDGVTVGVASLTRVPCDWSLDPDASRPEIAYACDRFAGPTYRTISELLDGSDIAIVLLHGSEELVDCPTDRTREVVSAWMEFGIDVVAVSQPHVLGGVERFDDGVVIWSTGNFAFPNNGGRTGRSAVFEVTIGPGGVDEVRVHPTVLPAGVAAPAPEEAAALVRSEVGERSAGGSIDDTGRLVPDPAPSVCDPA